MAQLKRMLNFASLQNEEDSSKRLADSAETAKDSLPPQPDQPMSQAPPIAQARLSNNPVNSNSIDPSFNLANSFNPYSFNPASLLNPWFNPYANNPWQWPSGMAPPTQGQQAPLGAAQAPWWASPPPAQPAGGRPSDSHTHDSSLVRESRTSGLLEKFKIKFEGKPRDDVEEFVQRIKEGQSSLGLTDRDILKMTPVIFAEDALLWARPLCGQWNTVAEMVEAVRLQFRPLDYKMRVIEDFRNRTQGPTEPTATYLSCMRALADNLAPPMVMEG